MTVSRTFVLSGPVPAKQLHSMLKQNAAAMAQQGRPLVVTVSEHKAKRNTAQNARYWVLLTHIAETAWVGGKRYSSLVWHDHLKGKFLGYEEAPDGSRVPMSSQNLSVSEFADYMTRVEAYALDELGLDPI